MVAISRALAAILLVSSAWLLGCDDAPTSSSGRSGAVPSANDSGEARVEAILAQLDVGETIDWSGLTELSKSVHPLSPPLLASLMVQQECAPLDAAWRRAALNLIQQHRLSPRKQMAALALVAEEGGEPVDPIVPCGIAQHASDPVARDAVALLATQRACQDGDSEMCEKLAMCLAELARSRPGDSCAEAAVLAFAMLGPRARPGVGVLLELQHGLESCPHAFAADAENTLGLLPLAIAHGAPDTPGIEASVVARILDGTGDARFAQALVRVNRQRALDLGIQLLRRGDLGWVHMGLALIGNARLRSNVAGELLLNLLTHDSQGPEQDIVEVILRVSPSADRVLPVAASLILSSRSRLRVAGCRLLSAFSDGDPEHLAALRSLVDRDADASVRQAAERALRRIEDQR